MSIDEIYSQLSPDQRAALAQEYLTQFQSAGATPGQFAGVDTSNVSAQQLAEMHKHAQQHHPEFLAGLRKHPLLIGVLGGVAAYEADKHFMR